MAQADADENGSDSQVTSKEKKELADLRRDKRRLDCRLAPDVCRLPSGTGQLKETQRTIAAHAAPPDTTHHQPSSGDHRAATLQRTRWTSAGQAPPRSAGHPAPSVISVVVGRDKSRGRTLSGICRTGAQWQVGRLLTDLRPTGCLLLGVVPVVGCLVLLVNRVGTGSVDIVPIEGRLVDLLNGVRSIDIDVMAVK
jgi:hypothetical protein